MLAKRAFSWTAAQGKWSTAKLYTSEASARDPIGNNNHTVNCKKNLNHRPEIKHRVMRDVPVCKKILNHVLKCFSVEAWYHSIHSVLIYFHNLQRMSCQEKRINKMDLSAHLTGLLKAHLIFTRKWRLCSPLRNCKCSHIGIFFFNCNFKGSYSLGKTKQGFLTKNLPSIQTVFSAWQENTFLFHWLFN